MSEGQVQIDGGRVVDALKRQIAEQSVTIALLQVQLEDALVNFHNVEVEQEGEDGKRNPAT